MYQRHEWKGKIIKHLEGNIGLKCHDRGLGNGFLKYDTKSTSNQRKKQMFITILKFFGINDTIIKTLTQNGRKYLQEIYLIWDPHPEFMNSCNSQYKEDK